MGGKLYIGTCSWTDRSLIDSGTFYPPYVRTPAERLWFYASYFPTVEVDSSFYAIPSVRNALLWAQRTPEWFVFHVKAYALFTRHSADRDSLPAAVRTTLPEEAPRRVYMHHLPPEARDALWSAFVRFLEPLHRAGKLGVVLFQFPPWFYFSREAMEHILACRERLEGFQLAVEFRHRSWLSERHRDETLGFLRENGLVYVAVDEPQGFRSSVPPVAEATAGVGYVRFHGRNVHTWEARGASASERFDYYYSDEELGEWVPRLRSLLEETERTYAMFNTNKGDQGVVNAMRLARLMNGEGLSPGARVAFLPD